MDEANQSLLAGTPLNLTARLGRARRTGLELEPGLSQAEWIEIGNKLAQIDSAVSWQIGDWWAFGESQYGARKQLTDAPDWAGPAYQTCATKAWVCRQFESSRRREVLSFEHHKTVAALPPVQADRLLDWAEAPLQEQPPGRVRSVHALRAEVRREALRDYEAVPATYGEDIPFHDWHAEDLTFRRGDCVQLMRTIPDDFVDLVVTSPPYGSLREYDGEWTVDLIELGWEIHRVLAPGGVAVLIVQDQTIDGAKSLTTFRTILKWCDVIGFTPFETLVYQRWGAPGWGQRFRVDHEYMPVFVKGERPAYFEKRHLAVPSKTIRPRQTARRTSKGSLASIPPFPPNDETSRGTVWQYQPNPRIDIEGAAKAGHPATFPDQLALDHIQCWTPPGGVVLDPFLGSGSTAVAALSVGRIVCGIDVSDRYLRIAKRRCEAVLRSRIAA